MSNPRNGPASRQAMPTTRDLEIIRVVCQQGALTREQLRHLCFRKPAGLASVQAACRRLKLLAERDYLRRMRIPTAMGSGPYVYLPGSRAQAALHAEELDLAGLGGRRRMRSVAELKHGLDVVDFYIGVWEGLERRGGQVIVWLSERQAHYALPGRGRTLPFTPDAYCLWRLGNEEGAFFLEWDRGTESLSRIDEKLARYEIYYGLQAYRDHLAEQGLRPRLLFVVNDERRQTQLTQWLLRCLHNGRWPSLPTVLITTQARSSESPMEPIWCQPGHDHQIRFID